jgi:hypothetical protein
VGRRAEDSHKRRKGLAGADQPCVASTDAAGVDLRAVGTSVWCSRGAPPRSVQAEPQFGADPLCVASLRIDGVRPLVASPRLGMRVGIRPAGA